MLNPNQQLTTTDHRRDLMGMTYVYPVVSRRSGGLSIGINLNPNNACNWACVYCQVEGLQRGAAPPIDTARLREELFSFLESVIHGSFMQDHVPEALRRLNDIAISGNGEPTTSAQFFDVISVISELISHFSLEHQIKVILITNGSQMHRPQVRKALEKMAELNGEVWFKLDRGTSQDLRQVNQTALSPQRALQELKWSADSCPTWIQSCFFGWEGDAPSESSVNAYLDILQQAKRDTLAKGVLLYGVERPSMQPDGSHITKLPASWMEALSLRIEETGLPVKLAV